VVQDSTFEAERGPSFLRFVRALVKSRTWAEIRRNFSGIMYFGDANAASDLGFVRRILGHFAWFKNG
jgi:hypothetical protein